MNQLFKSFQTNQQSTMQNVIPAPPANLGQLLASFAQSAIAEGPPFEKSEGGPFLLRKEEDK